MSLHPMSDFFEALRKTKLTADERDRLEAAFRAAMNLRGQEEYKRGHAAGVASVGKRDELTREEARWEVLEQVKAALGLDD